MSRLHLLLTGLVSGMGLIVSAVYFLGRLGAKDDSAERALWAKVDLPELYDRRRRRRTLGMAMMALISVVFFFGANFLNPQVYPPLAVAFWAVLLVLLMWLCLLALADLGDVRRLRSRLHEATRQMLYDEMGKSMGPKRAEGDRRT